MSAEESVSNGSASESQELTSPVGKPMATGGESQPSTVIQPVESETVADDNQQAAMSESSTRPVDESVDPLVKQASPQQVLEVPVEKPRRRVQLNPTGQLERLKAIPNRSADAASPANRPTPATTTVDSAKQSAEDQTVSDARKSGPSQSAGTSPIGIPPAVTDLDLALEDEIEAALANVQEEGEALHVEAQQANSDAQISDTTLDDLPEQGVRQSGIVQSVHGDNVFPDLGYRAPAVVPVRQFQSAKPPTVGHKVEIVVDSVEPDEGLILVSLPSGRQKLSGNWDEISVGQIVDCVATKTNKGGLEVNVSNLRGFLPAGQLDFTYVADLEPFVGKKMTVKIIEAKRERRKLVVSRRAYLEDEREELRKELWKTLEEGHILSGSVKTLKDYGAFVDIGGVDGFLHIGQISWARIGHPSEVLQVGQTVNVKIIKLDQENERISLGMKQLLADPWQTAAEKFPLGKTVSGKVTRTMDFGAFVELEQGIEGMVHVSELDYKHVKKVSDVLHVGQQIDVQVLDVNSERKRIALSLKALKLKPAEEEPEADEKAKEEPAARSAESAKGPLKGGIEKTGSGGGLFGNPRDYS